MAVTTGAARTRTNSPGGNVVCLRDASGGRTFDYAHLDQWAIGGVSRVGAGDVLGFVGNTGKARSTPPHLHFGIDEGAAINPLPFLRQDDPMPAAPTARAEHLGGLVRVVSARTPFRNGPDPRASIHSQLTRGTLSRALGVSRASVRGAQPMPWSATSRRPPFTSAAVPLRRDRRRTASVLRERPTPTAPAVEVIEEDVEVEVLGEFGRYDFLRVSRMVAGWAEKRPAATGGTPDAVTTTDVGSAGISVPGVRG